MNDTGNSHFDRDLQKTNPLDLAKLLALDAGLSWSDEDLAAILRHELQIRLQVELGPRVEGVCASELQQTFGELLTSALPSLPLLRASKEFAKANRSDPQAFLPGEVATVLYYAAIVAARLRWRARISQLSLADLLGGIDWTLARPWLAPSLSPLFAEAKSLLSLASPADPT
jgi:hypothetical protein